jgi:hypothetical protein
LIIVLYAPLSKDQAMQWLARKRPCHHHHSAVTPRHSRYSRHQACICPLRRRNEIELCARLLGIAAAGLHENPGLILFTVVAKIVMTLLVLPLFAFMFMSYTNGRIVPNGAATLALAPRLRTTSAGA